MVKPIPDGYRTITPYLTVDDLPRLMEFIQKAFGAEITEVAPGPDGHPSHAEANIGDSKLMMGQARGEWPADPGTLYLYVENADTTFAKAIDAGAQVIRELADQFYGDRSGGVIDPCGNRWWISTHIEDVPPEELQRRAAARK